LQTENLTLESPGVRQQIAQGLTEQRKQILNAALLETAMNEAKIVNHLASNMLNNPGNLGLRPAAQGYGSQPAQAPAPLRGVRPSESQRVPASSDEFARFGEAGSSPK
jgi:hypothetical protein